MNITQFAIEKNRITLVALICILIAGFSAYNSMPRNEDPGFIIRTAMVLTYFPGASPERVELLVSDKLEKVIQEIPQIDYISSESKTGVSIIYVNILEEYTDMRPIWDNLRRKVERATFQLPEGAMKPIVNDEFGDVFGTIFTITGDGFSYAELKDIADDCRDDLLLIDQVAKVDIIGGQEERVFVEYNNARLAELGLSPEQLKSVLQSANIVIPGGTITTGRERLVLEPSGNFETLEDIRRTVITLPASKDVLFLEDLAQVYRGYIDPPESIVLSNGVQALAIAINMREGGNILDFGRKVKQRVQRYQEAYPFGVDFKFVAFQPKFVEKKVNEFVVNLLQAVAIVMLVMLVTLGLRTGLVVASLIPTAMVMSLMCMGLFHIGLDQMSLASLIIALGMLVDNAIVMSESIMVQIAEGIDPKEAAISSAQELKIPLLTSSLTTATAFLPIFLAQSTVGEYTAPLFKVVTIALVCSWFLAISVTPLLCVHFIKIKKTDKKISYQSTFYKYYRSILLSCLRHKWVTAVIAIAVFLIAMQGFKLIPAIFFPENDKPIITAEYELPVGTPIERTEEVVKKIETFMQKQLLIKNKQEHGVKDWITFIGASAPRFVLAYSPKPSKPEYAMMIINLTSLDTASSIIDRLFTYCFETFPEIKPTIKLLALGPPVIAPVEIRLSGKDATQINAIADRVKQKLLSMQGAKNITDDWGIWSKKLVIDIDQPQARRAGLTSRDVAISLQSILSGYEATQFREDDKLIPVTLRSVSADRDDLGKLESHNIYVQSTGNSVPLKQVADVVVEWEPSKIFRRDRLKTITIQADLEDGYNAIAIADELDAWLAKQQKSWPIGYSYELGGEKESSGQANASIMAKLPFAGLIIVLLLVGQFNSIRRPLIIMLTIPLGMIGVVIGLLVCQSYFGFMTLLGVVSLSGIVINNAIVLLDRINIEIKENNRTPAQAIIESAQRRLRPILLTTATTVAGLVPLWLGGGPMWEPMAIAIIFGLLFATILTLGIVPILYSIFFRVSFKNFQY